MAWDLTLLCSDYSSIAAGTPALVPRNGATYLAFDAAAVESAEYDFALPDSYASGSNVDWELRMVAATATANNVRVRLEFMRVQLGTDNVDTDSFDTAVEANAAANGTNGIEFAATGALANGDMDAPAAGERMRVRISRVGDDATNDTMTGDAQYFSLKLSQ
jgi:hypothetical protein